MDDFGPDDERKQSVKEIVRTGIRARNLVRQLLAFSRKQTLEYRPLDLNQTIKGEQGTGLGLETVYGIVKQHGGNIWAYSEPGKGTSFKVYLPVSEENHAKQETTEKTDVELDGSGTILLVEDDEAVRHLARAILKRNGYTLFVAEGGVEALDLMASYNGPLDLVLTDVAMPDMNGSDLFKRVAENFPGIKVLFMSGYTDNVIAHRGILDEGIQFISKPFTVQGLTNKVREVLDQDYLG